MSRRPPWDKSVHVDRSPPPASIGAGEHAFFLLEKVLREERAYQLERQRYNEQDPYKQNTRRLRLMRMLKETEIPRLNVLKRHLQYEDRAQLRRSPAIKDVLTASEMPYRNTLSPASRLAFVRSGGRVLKGQGLRYAFRRKLQRNIRNPLPVPVPKRRVARDQRVVKPIKPNVRERKKYTPFTIPAPTSFKKGTDHQEYRGGFNRKIPEDIIQRILRKEGRNRLLDSALIRRIFMIALSIKNISARGPTRAKVEPVEPPQKTEISKERWKPTMKPVLTKKNPPGDFFLKMDEVTRPTTNLSTEKTYRSRPLKNLNAKEGQFRSGGYQLGTFSEVTSSQASKRSIFDEEDSNDSDDDSKSIISGMEIVSPVKIIEQKSSIASMASSPSVTCAFEEGLFPPKVQLEESSRLKKTSRKARSKPDSTVSKNQSTSLSISEAYVPSEKANKDAAPRGPPSPISAGKLPSEPRPPLSAMGARPSGPRTDLSSGDMGTPISAAGLGPGGPIPPLSAEGLGPRGPRPPLSAAGVDSGGPRPPLSELPPAESDTEDPRPTLATGGLGPGGPRPSLSAGGFRPRGPRPPLSGVTGPGDPITSPSADELGPGGSVPPPSTAVSGPRGPRPPLSAGGLGPRGPKPPLSAGGLGPRGPRPPLSAGGPGPRVPRPPLSGAVSGLRGPRPPLSGAGLGPGNSKPPPSGAKPDAESRKQPLSPGLGSRGRRTPLSTEKIDPGDPKPPLSPIGSAPRGPGSFTGLPRTSISTPKDLEHLQKKEKEEPLHFVCFLAFQKYFFMYFLPYFFLQGLESMSIIVTTFFASRISETYLNGVGIGASTANVFIVSSMYGYTAVFETYGPQIFGSPNPNLLGTLVIKCILQGLAVYMFVIGIFVNIVHVLGYISQFEYNGIQEDEIAIAKQFILLASGYGILDYCVDIFNKYLLVQRRGTFVYFISMTYFAVHITSNYFLVLKLEMGLIGLAGSMYIARGFNLLLQISYCLFLRCRGKLAWAPMDYHVFDDWGKMLKIGISGILTLLADIGILEISTFISQFTTTTDVTCALINLQCFLIVEAFTLSHSHSTNMMIGKALGKQNKHDVHEILFVTLLNTVLMSVPIMYLLWHFRIEIATLFTDTSDTIKRYADLNYLPAIFLSLNYVATIMTRGVLTSFGKQHFSAILSSVTSYVIGLPLIITFVFKTDMGIEGVFIGFVVCGSVKFLASVVRLLLLDIQHELNRSFQRVSRFEASANMFSTTDLTEDIQMPYDWAKKGEPSSVALNPKKGDPSETMSIITFHEGLRKKFMIRAIVGYFIGICWVVAGYFLAIFIEIKY